MEDPSAKRSRRTTEKSPGIETVSDASSFFIEHAEDLVMHHVVEFCCDSSLYALRATSRSLQRLAENILRGRSIQKFPLELPGSGRAKVSVAWLERTSITFENSIHHRDALFHDAWQRWHFFLQENRVPLDSSSIILSENSLFRLFGTQERFSVNAENENGETTGVTLVFSYKEDESDVNRENKRQGITKPLLSDTLNQLKRGMRSEFSIPTQQRSIILRAILHLMFHSTVTAVSQHSIFCYDVLSGQRMRSILLRLTNPSPGIGNDGPQEKWLEIVCSTSFSHI